MSVLLLLLFFGARAVDVGGGLEVIKESTAYTHQLIDSREVKSPVPHLMDPKTGD